MSTREDQYKLAIELAAAQADYSKFSVNVEDTDPEFNMDFLIEPHKELFPCAFRGGTHIPPEVVKTLKDHVLKSIETEYKDADDWIYFTVYGSGISYMWSEEGDFDIQMWVDYSKFQDNDTPITADDLVADIRRLTQLVNFPSFKELGLGTKDCEGRTLVQYYPKPGTGSKEENLASKPYACYDLETGEWLKKPMNLNPKFYGDRFLMILPKVQDIAIQSEAALDELQRNIIQWQFWTGLNAEEPDKRYKAEADAAQAEAESQREAIKNLFHGVFGGRAEAYSPGGKGIQDERDLTEKLLEVWGIFQRLRHAARAPLPWEEGDLPDSPTEKIPSDQSNNEEADTDKSSKNHWHIIADWEDVQNKAIKYYQDGQVKMIMNSPTHAIATVNSETDPGKSYQTELWRDDPNSNAITLWSCTCPWGEVSWGRCVIMGT